MADGGALQQVAEQGLGRLLQLDRRVVGGGPAPEHGLSTEGLPWARDLEARRREVREELDHLLESDVRLPVTDDLVGVEQGADGRWTTYVLCWFDRWLEFNCRRCPVTTELVRAVPGVEIAGFTVMHAGTHIPAHRGPAKALRYQLGIKVPEPAGSCRLRVGDEVIEHAEGKSLMFDDLSEHEAWNDSDEDRYVLFVQHRFPLPPGRREVHRAAHWAFGKAQSSIPKRAEELDAALNRGR